MTDFFYEYKVYFDSEGLEHTLLKWFNNGNYADSNKIDKPTKDLTSDDIKILNLFIEAGSVVQEKTKITLPQDNPGNNM
jgi:hypothetical protein